MHRFYTFYYIVYYKGFSSKQDTHSIMKQAKDIKWQVNEQYRYWFTRHMLSWVALYGYSPLQLGTWPCTTSLWNTIQIQTTLCDRKSWDWFLIWITLLTLKLENWTVMVICYDILRTSCHMLCSFIYRFGQIKGLRIYFHSRIAFLQACNLIGLRNS